MTCLKWAAGWLLLGMLCLGGAGCLPTERVTGGEEDDPDFQAGLTHKSSGRPLRAVESFERALQRNPNSVSAHFELGLLYYQGVTNYVAALYHFDRVQLLNPQFKYNQMVEQMIRGCKQEFMRDIPMGTITWQMQQDLQKLQRLEQENGELRRRIEQLRIELAAHSANDQPGGANLSEASRSPTTRGAASLRATASNERLIQPVTRTGASSYVVTKGDTIYSIARRHDLHPNALLAANPGVDPKLIHPGQTLVVPSR
jgi:tetratricopeptide (TPR) repeat protein